MSNLKQYELFIRYNHGQTAQGEEAKYGRIVIGGDQVSTPFRALEPTLKTEINGNITFSFKMQTQVYQNNIQSNNPYLDYLHNETQLILICQGKIYPLIITNKVENSAENIVTFNAESAIIHELSKNGFGVTLNEKLNNNIGTAASLIQKVLADTDWTVSTDSEPIIQTVEEHLVPVQVTEDVISAHLIDDTQVEHGVVHDVQGTVGILKNSVIYVFQSILKEPPRRFSFVYLGVGDNLIKPTFNSHNVLTTKNVQYYVDQLPKYKLLSQENELVQIKNYQKGKRYVFTQQIKYLDKLDKYAKVYYQDSLANEIYEYIDTAVISNKTLVNLSPNNQFTTTTGWSSDDNVELSVAQGIIDEKGNFIDVKDVFANNSKDLVKCQRYLKITPKNNTASTIKIKNNCFYANRNLLKNLNNGRQFLIDKCISTSGVQSIQAVHKTSEGTQIISSYPNKILTINTTIDQSELVNCWLELTFPNTTIYLSDFVICEAHKIIDNTASTTDDYYTPDYFIQHPQDLCKVEKRYNYINRTNWESAFDVNDLTIETQLDKPRDDIYPLYYKQIKTDSNQNTTECLCVATKPINVQESNYFNIIQTIAETFNCWVDFDVSLNENNNLVNKKVIVKNYNYKYNNIGFHYESNLQSVSRTIDSKQLVSKLFVKNNSNKFAQDGFCSVARASANESADNCLYNFDYYFNHNLLNAADFIKDTENMIGGYGKDLSESMTEWNSKGYFPRLANINKKLIEIGDSLNNIHSDYYHANSERIVALEGKNAAEQEQEKIKQEFLQLTGKALNNEVLTPTPLMITGLFGPADLESKHSIEQYYNPSSQTVYVKTTTPYKIELSTQWKQYYDIQIRLLDTDVIIKRPELTSTSVEQIECSIEIAKDSKVMSLIEKYLDLETQKNKYTDLYNKYAAVCENNKVLLKSYTTDQKTWIDYKNQLTQCFNKKYSGFIKEGTWISEQYSDDNQYYYDALSTLYTSAFPQVTYTINVLDLSGIELYKDFIFNVGELTTVTDKEIFGINEDGIPHEEDIVITAINENLDDPTKTSIEVKNYRDNEQELFQKITAQVQETKFSTGAYQKGAALANADSEEQNIFIQDGLKSAVALTIGNQQIEQNLSGLYIKDQGEKGRTLKLTGGAILMGTVGKDFKEIWTTGITADGINASVVNTGSLNTNAVTIKNGEIDAFIWDKNGLSAFLNNDGKIVGKGGVRFCKDGIYGSEDLDDPKANKPFELTWKGLHIKSADSEIHIGQQNNNLIEIKKVLSESKSEDMLVLSKKGEMTISGWHINSNAIYKNGSTTTDGTGMYASNTIENQVGNDFIRFYAGGQSINDTIGNSSTLQKSAFYVTKNGAIKATKGTIGGWEITSDTIQKTTLKQEGAENIINTIGLVSSNSVPYQEDYARFYCSHPAQELAFNVYNNSITFTQYGGNQLKCIFTIDHSLLPAYLPIDQYSLVDMVCANNFVLYLHTNTNINNTIELYKITDLYEPQNSNLFITTTVPVFTYNAINQYYQIEFIMNLPSQLTFTNILEIQWVSGTIYANIKKPNAFQIYPFIVNSNGTVSMQNANINGTIQTVKGQIGSFSLTDEGFANQDIILDRNQLTFLTNDAGITFRDFSLINYEDMGLIHANGPLLLSSGNKLSYDSIVTGIKLNAGSGENRYSYDNKIYVKIFEYPDTHIKQVTIKVTSTERLLYPVGLSIKIKGMYEDGYSEEHAQYFTYSLSQQFTASFELRKKGLRRFNINQYSVILQLDNLKYNSGMQSADWSDQNKWVYLATEPLSQTRTNNYIEITGSFIPTQTETFTLGNHLRLWQAIYGDKIYANTSNILQPRSASGTITNSDAMVKNNVVPIPTNFDAFYDSLKPVNFTYSYGTSNRKHFGLIAQDIKKSLDDLNISTQDCAIYCEYPEPDAQGATCGIRYEELIPLNIWEIQELKRRIAELEKKIENLTKPTNSDIIQVESKESKSEEIQ